MFQDIIQFAKFLWGKSISVAQLTFLAVFLGLQLAGPDRALWRRYAAEKVFARYVPRVYREALALLGRQSGKSSRIGVTVALYEALVVPREIPPGERLAILFFAPTLRQSTFDQVCEKLRATPELAQFIENDAGASGEIRLSNGIDLVNLSANPRHARGRVAILAIIDECAFIRTDSDFQMNLPELLESIRPSLIVHGGKLLLLSSPSGKEGPLFSMYEQRAENPDMLVWRAPSAAMNPSISEKLLEKERKRGDAYFRREYLAEFVDATNPFLPVEALESAIAKGVPEFEPKDGDETAVAGLDLADKRDDCALAISTIREIDGKRKIVVQLAKLWKPGPNGHVVPKVLEEMGTICERFGVCRAKGDQKSMSTAEFILSQHAVRFERTITDGQGSESMYRTFLGSLNNADIVLPDNPELITQLKRLEERTGDGNRFRVAGRRNTKDDLAVATILSVSIAAERLLLREPTPPETIWLDSSGTGNWREDRFFRQHHQGGALSRPRNSF